LWVFGLGGCGLWCLGVSVGVGWGCLCGLGLWGGGGLGGGWLVVDASSVSPSLVPSLLATPPLPRSGLGLPCRRRLSIVAGAGACSGRRPVAQQAVVFRGRCAPTFCSPSLLTVPSGSIATCTVDGAAVVLHHLGPRADRRDRPCSSTRRSRRAWRSAI